MSFRGCGPVRPPEQVDLRFEESIAALVDEGDRVAVTFASGREADYDIVVGADGVHSAVRRLVFGPEADFSEPLGVHVAIADAPAHCATPMAGRGTSLALLGAWTLTEELGRHDDVEAAFSAYEQRQRPHAAAAQEFARGGADLVVPATWEAIEARNTRLRAAQR